MRPRMAVLFGLLTRLGQQGMEPVSRGAPPGEANVMAVAKQVLNMPLMRDAICCDGVICKIATGCAGWTPWVADAPLQLMPLPCPAP